jgi:phosphoserine phosphatase
MRGKWLTTVLAASLLVAMKLPAQALDRMNWAPRNHAALERLIREVGTGSPGYDAQKPPYAVIDWDQTSAFLDCQEAMLRFQIRQWAFKLPPEAFAALLPGEINGVRGVSIDGKVVALAAIHADLITAYQFCQDQLKKGAALDALRRTAQYQDFATKLPLAYEAYCQTPGIGAAYGYPWVTYLLAGHTAAQVRGLAKHAIETALVEPIAAVTWEGPQGFTSQTGPMAFSFRSALRVLPEMQDLMASLRGAGIGVYIVSASLKPVVEAFSGPGQFGYDVPADHIIAMEMAAQDGVLQPWYKPDGAPTFGPGKVTAIRKALSHLGDPVFGAGDSDGDYEMLTGFPGMKLALVFNRLKGGPIGSLCQKAVAEKDKPLPRYLLQGRNENTGLLIPSMETIGFGKSAPQLVK